MKKDNLTKKEKGFTLIETLVAIFILVIAITGPMSAASNSLKASFLARDQVVAFYLAQDAVEAIKNLRDDQALGGDDWREIPNLKGNCISPSGNYKECNFSPGDNSNIYTCGSGGNADIYNLKCDPLKIETGTKKFYYSSGSSGSGGTESKFTRSIFMKVGSHTAETEIVVVVEWNTNLYLTDTKRVVIQDNIFNWIPTN